MNGKVARNEICPICGTDMVVNERTWFYTCTGCGSGINMIGIWLHNRTGEKWSDISPEEKKAVGLDFFSRDKEEIDWSNVIIEI